MTNNTIATSELDTTQLNKFNLTIDYSLMRRQNRLRPHSTPFRRSHTKFELDDPIKGYKIFPDNVDPPADVCYIKHTTSLHSLTGGEQYEGVREQLLRPYIWSEFPNQWDSQRRCYSDERLQTGAENNRPHKCKLLETTPHHQCHQH